MDGWPNAVRGLRVVVVGLGACALTLASGSAPAAPVESAVAPRTLVRLTVPISSFAQDGGRIAWITGRCRDFRRPVDDVVVRAVSGGVRHRLAKVCSYFPGVGGTAVALSGRRAALLWPVSGGNYTYYSLALLTSAALACV